MWEREIGLPPAISHLMWSVFERERKCVCERERECVGEREKDLIPVISHLCLRECVGERVCECECV